MKLVFFKEENEIKLKLQIKYIFLILFYQCVKNYAKISSERLKDFYSSNLVVL